MALTTATKTKLSKLIPLLGSDNSGEVAATAAAIKRVLDSSHMDFIDLGKQLTKTTAAEKVTPKDKATIKIQAELLEEMKDKVSELEDEISDLEDKIEELNSEIDDLKNEKGELYNDNLILKDRRIIDFSGLGKCLFWAAVVIGAIYFNKGH